MKPSLVTISLNSLNSAATSPAPAIRRPLRRYRHPWKIERTFAWLGAFRRLVVRYERNPNLHLACAIITPRYLRNRF